MRGRLGYPSDTCPLNNRSFAFISTGRSGVLCGGRRSEKFTERTIIITVLLYYYRTIRLCFLYNQQSNRQKHVIPPHSVLILIHLLHAGTCGLS